MSDNREEREEPRGRPEGLEPDPLAERLGPDGAVMLVGILRQGPAEDERHLFLNTEMTRRAEFKTSDVLHAEKIREEDPPFLGAQATRVYLRRGARLVYTTTRSREVQAEFLRGAIAEGFHAGAAESGTLGAPLPILRPVDTCSNVGPSLNPDCPTIFGDPCPKSLYEICITPTPSVGIWCPC